MFFSPPSFTTDNIPDLTGRVALVTGANGGIGYHTALALARSGAKVYLAARSEDRARAAIEQITALVPDAKERLAYLHFDLTSLASAKAAAETFLAAETRLDILVNNAGILTAPYEITADGIEVQACNATGHFALTVSLLPILRATTQLPDAHVRIVNVASEGHRAANKLDFSSLEMLNRPFATSMHRYNNSKLMNVLFNNELQRRLDGTGIYCITLHPGLVGSNMYQNMYKTYPILTPFKYLEKLVLAAPEQGALTQLYAATSPEVETKDLKAAYLIPTAKVSKPSTQAQDKDGKLAAQFWTLCESLVA
ncbi:hypothetical protein MKEN_01207600 [Mycena kentingensis (nom. inval.)]|nr:hypothetical protein MKEN_01207600 [Mycena kentingensis (nom. inval.)]